MSQIQDLTGQRFGRLTVTGRARNAKSGKVMWLCRCDCGKEKAVCAQALKKGVTKSCGCLKAERAVKPRSHARLSAYDELRRVKSREKFRERWDYERMLWFAKKEKTA